MHMPSVKYLVFEYLYRDASNFKSFGRLWVRGELSQIDKEELLSCLDIDNTFVAEQIGIPALYDELFSYSNGRTCDDHSWHEFSSFQDKTELPANVEVWGTTRALLSSFKGCKDAWDPEHSPNFCC